MAHLHPCHTVLGVVSQVSKVWVEESYENENKSKKCWCYRHLPFLLQRKPSTRKTTYLFWQRYAWQGRIRSSAKAGWGHRRPRREALSSGLAWAIVGKWASSPWASSLLARSPRWVCPVAWRSWTAHQSLSHQGTRASSWPSRQKCNQCSTCRPLSSSAASPSGSRVHGTIASLPRACRFSKGCQKRAPVQNQPASSSCSRQSAGFEASSLCARYVLHGSILRLGSIGKGTPMRFERVPADRSVSQVLIALSLGSLILEACVPWLDPKEGQSLWLLGRCPCTFSDPDPKTQKPGTVCFPREWYLKAYCVQRIRRKKLKVSNCLDVYLVWNGRPILDSLKTK